MNGLIYKEDAIKAAIFAADEWDGGFNIQREDMITDAINALTSAQPERKKGKWILVHPLQEDDIGAYMCSECKVGNWEIDPKSYFFCPNCGADMRGEPDE